MVEVSEKDRKEIDELIAENYHGAAIEYVYKHILHNRRKLDAIRAVNTLQIYYNEMPEPLMRIRDDIAREANEYL